MSNADFLLGLTGLGLIGASNLYNQRRPRTTDVQPQSTVSELNLLQSYSTRFLTFLF